MVSVRILLMLDAGVGGARQAEIVERIRELIEKGGGTWSSHVPWGKRRLAFEIDKKNDGIYHLLQFDADPETLDEIGRVLQISDGVMRHLATAGSRLGTAPPPGARAGSRCARAGAEPRSPPRLSPPAAAAAPAAEAVVEAEPQPVPSGRGSEAEPEPATESVQAAE